MELENDLEEATEAGYGPEVVVDSSVREHAEEMARENAPPRKRIVAAYQTALIFLVSACAVLVPQHVLLSSWTIPVGWAEILAIVAIFSVISLLSWHKFSSVVYNGRKVDGIFFSGDVWAFTPGLLIGLALRVYNLEHPAAQVFEWSWWASLAVIGLALLARRLHRISTAVPVSPHVEAGQKREGPSKSAKASLVFALVAFFCNLTAWLMSDGLSKDWATIMVIASALLLATILPAFERRERKPSVFEDNSKTP